ncbi:unnamed protein product, partial [Tenebrio molitor]
RKKRPQQKRHELMEAERHAVREIISYGKANYRERDFISNARYGNSILRWPKIEDNRKVLMESYDIRLLRIEYFKQILKHRDEGRPTFYTDESYVHTTHLPNHSWTDRSGKCVKKSVAS